SLQESDIILALSVGDDLSRMIPTKSIRTKMLAGMRGSEAAGIEMPSQRKRLSRRTRRGAVEPSTYSPFCRQSRFRPPSFRRSGQYDPVLRQQRRRGEDEENPRERLGYRSLNSNGTPGPCQMHAGSVVVPPEVEVVVPPALEVVVSPELEGVVVAPELEVVVPPVLVEVVDVLATTSTTFV